MANLAAAPDRSFYRMAEVIGDELALRAELAAVDLGQTSRVVGVVMRYIRQANAGVSPLRLAGVIAQELVSFPKVMKQEYAGFCEVAQQLARRLGFEGNLITALGQTHERWDGKGMPAGLKGNNILRPVQLVSLAGDVTVFYRLEGIEAAMKMVRTRTGTSYPPEIAEIFLREGPDLLAGIAQELNWEIILAEEPGGPVYLSEEQFDNACEVIADFTDLKSPYTIGHSRGVAALAARAATCYGLPKQEVAEVRQAGLVHDIGRVGISAGIWGKAGPLSGREWEQVRLHPYYTERVLARPPFLARLGKIAALHHEQLTGQGYHRGLPGSLLPVSARLLMAADIYHAMTEIRPHRPALTPEMAAGELQAEVKSGRLTKSGIFLLHHLRKAHQFLGYNAGQPQG